VTRGWLDIHGHFEVPATSREQEARLEKMQAAGFRGSHAALTWSAEHAFDFMGRSGVSMQLLSNYISKTSVAVVAANTHGASIVQRYPSQFGFLASLPLAEPDLALTEIHRATHDLEADGFALQTNYGGTYLGDASLNAVWDALNRLGATVFLHPAPYGQEALSLGRPTWVLEATFDTARTVVDMLYAGVFRKFPDIRFILAHAGGALPAVAGRVATLGTTSSVPNPIGLTSAEVRETLAGLYYDTGLLGTGACLDAVLAITSPDHILYGADIGAPCSYEDDLLRNLDAIRTYPRLTAEQRDAIGRNAWALFPKAAQRVRGNVTSAG
jgi:predicted TIM-barrel fold metal-dependent hydrolase